MFSKDGDKPDMHVGQESVDAGEAYSSSKGGTAADQIDMFRMGKVQELKVCFISWPEVKGTHSWN